MHQLLAYIEQHEIALTSQRTGCIATGGQRKVGVGDFGGWSR